MTGEYCGRLVTLIVHNNVVQVSISLFFPLQSSLWNSADSYQCLCHVCHFWMHKIVNIASFDGFGEVGIGSEYCCAGKREERKKMGLRLII
jgi:hypothetical protein